eukprot:scaffold3852_cov129-Isochrysis_galbana.AAC.4
MTNGDITTLAEAAALDAREGNGGGREMGIGGKMIRWVGGLAILVRLVIRIRTNSVSQTRPVSRAWFSPSSKSKPRDVSNRARRRFVSSRFIQFMYNLRFDRLLSILLFNCSQPLQASL